MRGLALAALLLVAACGIKAMPEAPAGAYPGAPVIPRPAEAAAVSN